MRTVTTSSEAGRLSAFLRAFIDDHQVRIVLDVPCGDWRTAPRLDWNEVQYIGLDGDAAVIEANRRRRDKPTNCYFHHADTPASQLSPVDLLLIRDTGTPKPPPDLSPILDGPARHAHVLVVDVAVDEINRRALGARHETLIDRFGLRVRHWPPPAPPTPAGSVDWGRVHLTDENAASYTDIAAASCTSPNRAFDGRGVVIAAGGPVYLPCAWVCVRMLRHFGCSLPIEMWHLGPDEMPGPVRRMLEPLGVWTVDAMEVHRTHPVRQLDGWSLKPYAIMHSRFRDVLMLDADNVPIVDPTFLFDTAEFRKRGAIFWPDYHRLAPHRSIWRVTGVPYRDEPEFESGEIVVDKAACWRELSLAMWMNEFGDFFYRHVYGDKETFHMAWRKLRRPYAMTRHPLVSLSKVMCQHDFDGRRIFQHRNFAKFSLTGPNKRIDGFLHEEQCFAYLRELAELDGVPWWTVMSL